MLITWAVNKSRPARGVWIEMATLETIDFGEDVTPRKGRVD